MTAKWVFFMTGSWRDQYCGWPLATDTTVFVSITECSAPISHIRPFSSSHEGVLVRSTLLYKKHWLSARRDLGTFLPRLVTLVVCNQTWCFFILFKVIHHGQLWASTQYSFSTLACYCAVWRVCFRNKLGNSPGGIKTATENIPPTTGVFLQGLSSKQGGPCSKWWLEGLTQSRGAAVLTVPQNPHNRWEITTSWYQNTIENNHITTFIHCPPPPFLWIGI